MSRPPLQFYAVVLGLLFTGCNETAKTPPPVGVAALGRIFGKGDENPGQMIVIAYDSSGNPIHLPEKPCRIYLGAKVPNDATKGYEEVSIHLYNFTLNAFDVSVWEMDAEKAITPSTPNGSELPPATASVAGKCVVSFKIDTANVETALGPYSPGRHRSYKYEYRIDLIDKKSGDTLEIDPELVVEGRP